MKAVRNSKRLKTNENLNKFILYFNVVQYEIIYLSWSNMEYYGIGN